MINHPNRSKAPKQLKIHGYPGGTISVLHVISDAGHHSRPENRVAYIQDPTCPQAEPNTPIGEYTCQHNGAWIDGRGRQSWPDWASELPEWATERLATWETERRAAALTRAEADIHRVARNNPSGDGGRSLKNLPALSDQTIKRWQEACANIHPSYLARQLSDMLKVR